MTLAQLVEGCAWGTGNSHVNSSNPTQVKASSDLPTYIFVGLEVWVGVSHLSYSITTNKWTIRTIKLAILGRIG